MQILPADSVHHVSILVPVFIGPLILSMILKKGGGDYNGIMICACIQFPISVGHKCPNKLKMIKGYTQETM
jgi:hypothetical protein